MFRTGLLVWKFFLIEKQPSTFLGLSNPSALRLRRPPLERGGGWGASWFHSDFFLIFYYFLWIVKEIPQCTMALNPPSVFLNELLSRTKCKLYGSGVPNGNYMYRTRVQKNKLFLCASANLESSERFVSRYVWSDESSTMTDINPLYRGVPFGKWVPTVTAFNSTKVRYIGLYIKVNWLFHVHIVLQFCW